VPTPPYPFLGQAHKYLSTQLQPMIAQTKCAIFVQKLMAVSIALVVAKTCTQIMVNASPNAMLALSLI